MLKTKPTPPDTDPALHSRNPDPENLHEPTDRIPSAADIRATPRKPCSMFIVDTELDTESLLAHACESLASATVMLGDFAALLKGTHRKTLLGIAQVVMLGELAVNKALDNVDPAA